MDEYARDFEKGDRVVHREWVRTFATVTYVATNGEDYAEMVDEEGNAFRTRASEWRRA